eukprot:6480948-Amphidinium_carterae.1
MDEVDDPELLQAFAAAAQAKGHFRKLKGKSSGKGKANKTIPPVPSSTASGPPAVGNTDLPFKIQGSGSFQLQQQRQKRLANLKQRTRCSVCHQFGHWAGDSQCPKNSGKSGKGTAYFTISEDLNAATIGQALVARRRPAMTFLSEPCAHCQTAAIQRGANGTQRHLKCVQCDMFLVQVTRPRGSRD